MFYEPSPQTNTIDQTLVKARHLLGTRHRLSLQSQAILPIYKGVRGESLTDPFTLLLYCQINKSERIFAVLQFLFGSGQRNYPSPWTFLSLDNSIKNLYITEDDHPEVMYV